MTLGVVLLLLVMGVGLGSDHETLAKLVVYGGQAVVFTLGTVGFSVLLVFFLEQLMSHGRSIPLIAGHALAEQKAPAAGSAAAGNPYRLTAIIMAAVILGILGGITIFPAWAKGSLQIGMNVALDFTLFCVGLDLGQNRDVWRNIRHLGWRVLVAPLGVAVGSVVAGMFVGTAFGWTWQEGGAVGAGFGWYSLSGVLISQLHSAGLGTIAFLSNVLRELLSLVLVPWLARRVGLLTLVAPGGATTMDTTLPIIAAAGPPGAALVALTNGISLTALVPLLIPLLLG